jgi:distribution and morphology protein 31
MIPNENDDSIAKVISDFYDRVEATVTSNGNKSVIDNSDGTEVQQLPQSSEALSTESEDNRFIIMDLRVHLNDVRAAVPILTRDITYINNALVRPIVAYINSKKTFIPVNCRVVKRASEFDGSWTIYDSGLMDDLSREVITAFQTFYERTSNTFRRCTMPSRAMYLMTTLPVNGVSKR